MANTLRVMTVDVTGDTPVVTSNTKMHSNLYFASSGEVPSTLVLPSLGRVVVCNGTTFTVWANDGTRIAEIELDDGDNYLPNVFSNPDDLTECAVVYDSSRLFVVKGLDTDAPVIDRIIPYPVFSDDWMISATNPYFLSHGLMDGGNSNYGPVTDSSITLPIPWRNLNEIGPDRYIGAFEGWYDDPAGTAKWGRARVIHQHVSEQGFDDATDYGMEAVITDYRDPDDLKVTILNWHPGAVIPQFPVGEYSLDWLSAGSHSITADADGTKGVALSGYTTLSTDVPDTTSVPEVTIYDASRFSVVVTLLQGPTQSTDTGGESADLLTGDPVSGTVTVGVPTPVFYQGLTGFSDTSPGAGAVIPPDSEHIVVGTQALDSADNTSYLEYTVPGPTDYLYIGDCIGGILEAPTVPAGQTISGDATFEFGFWSTAWRSDVPYYGIAYSLVPVIAGSTKLDWDNGNGADTMPIEPTSTWRLETPPTGYPYSVSRASIDALLAGRLACIVWPQGQGPEAATLRVSYMKVTFGTVGLG